MTTTTGLKGQPVDAIIERFYGDISRWPLESKEGTYSQSEIRAICTHISCTGNCLWHAQSIVMQWPCACANCMRP